MKVKLEPLADRVIVKRDESELRTFGGLHLPDSAKKDGTATGTILAVGKGGLDSKGERRPPDVAVGNKIIFPAHSGIEVKIDGENVLILGEKDILSTIIEEEQEEQE